MGDKQRNIIIGIISAILIIALSVGWIIWRRNVTKPTTQPGEDQQTTSQTTPDNTPTDTGDTTPQQDQPNSQTPTTLTLTQDQINQYTQAVNTYEHTSRDWGTDPTAATNPNLALQPTNIINNLRTPATMDPTNLDAISSIQRDTTKIGPTAPSPWCNTDNTSPWCDEQKTMLDYWRNNNWIMGARHTADPKITYNPSDNTFTAEGTIHAILWSQDTGTGYRGSTPEDTYWAYTPVTGDFNYKDQISFDYITGKVNNRKTITPVTQWLADPWYMDWNTNPSEQTMSWTNRQQANIPLHGTQPQLITNQMKPNADISFLKNLTTTEGGLWDKVPTPDLPDTSVPEE